MDLPKKNSEIFALQLWHDFSAFKLLSPKKEWPHPKKGEFHAASSLDMNFFQWVTLPEADISNFQRFIASLKEPRLFQKGASDKKTRLLGHTLALAS
jgi:hypothetical protein